MIGETFGSYRVTGKIGEGGMGAVYLAEHTLLGRKAAVKVLLPEHSRNQDLVARFFNEAKTAASLNHPALVDVFDFGVHPQSGSAYLVMDFLEGESLGARLTRVAPLPYDTVIDLGRQIARAMDVAHGHGIVHRDLKPDNIFLVPDADDPAREKVKILDFGVAKLLGKPGDSKGGATSTGMVLGTPLFMAPEQCRGAGVVDHRADIYSLGCILYLMVCARPPFDYEGVGELLAAHLHEAVTPPRLINPTLPAPLEEVVLRSLAKKPEERFQSMGELAAALRQLVGPGGTISIATPSRENLPMAPSSPGLPVHPSSPGTPVGPAAAAASGSRPAGAPLAPGPTTLSSAVSSVSAAPPAAPTERMRPRAALPWALAGAFAAGVAITAVALVRSRAPVAVVAPAGPAPVAPPTPTPRPTGGPPPPPPPAVAIPAPTPLPPPVPTPAGGEQPTAVPDAAATPPAATPASEEPPKRRVVRRPEGGTQPAGTGGDTGQYARGVTLLARGDERGALEAFRAYLSGDRLPAAQRSDAERHVLSLQRKFGEIELTCDLTGADVTVDGRFVGRTPLARPVLLRPGSHDLTVTKEGYAPVRRSFQLGAGERKPFFIRLPR